PAPAPEKRLTGDRGTPLKGLLRFDKTEGLTLGGGRSRHPTQGAPSMSTNASSASRARRVCLRERRRGPLEWARERGGCARGAAPRPWLRRPREPPIRTRLLHLRGRRRCPRSPYRRCPPKPC